MCTWTLLPAFGWAFVVFSYFVGGKSRQWYWTEIWSPSIDQASGKLNMSYGYRVPNQVCGHVLWLWSEECLDFLQILGKRQGESLREHVTSSSTFFLYSMLFKLSDLYVFRRFFHKGHEHKISSYFVFLIWCRNLFLMYISRFNRRPKLYNL